MNFCRWVVAGATLWSCGIWAQSYHRDNFRDIRWLGRGNTGIAVINDGTALFYNPAGIGMQNVYSFSVLNPSLGANENIYTSAAGLSSLTGGSESITSKFGPFLGKPLGLTGSVFPHIAVPNFAGGFWDYFDTSLQYRNPVNPELYMDARNDYGIILGTGFGYQQNFAFGVSLRYHRRRLLSESITGSRALTLVQGASGSTLASLMKKGEGFGINVGIQSKFEVNKATWVALGGAVEDLGATKFKSALGNAPIQQGMQMNIGSALGIKTTLLDLTIFADGRQLNVPGLHDSKKIFMGTEFSFLKTDFRAGLFQGYWTLGASLRLFPLFDIDLATYGEEVGYASGIKQNRIWMLGISTGIGLNVGGKKQSKSGKKYRSQLDAL